MPDRAPENEADDPHGRRLAPDLLPLRRKV